MGKQCIGRRSLRNEKNRKRNQLLNFHLTPEDKEKIYKTGETIREDIAGLYNSKYIMPEDRGSGK